MAGTRQDLRSTTSTRMDLSDDEAKELGDRSIYAAGHGDAYSGNSCNLHHIKETGWEHVGELTDCILESLRQHQFALSYCALRTVCSH